MLALSPEAPVLALCPGDDMEATTGHVAWLLLRVFLHWGGHAQGCQAVCTEELCNHAVGNDCLIPASLGGDGQAVSVDCDPLVWALTDPLAWLPCGS